jgi:hypothetical protein
MSERASIVLDPAHLLQTYVPDGGGSEYWGPWDSVADAAGQVTIVWRPGDAFDGSMRVATRHTDGTWEETQTLAVPDPETAWRWRPQIAADAQGNVTVMWHAVSGDDSTQNVLVSWRTAEGPWNPVIRLSPINQVARHPNLAVSADGTALITWEGTPSHGGTQHAWMAAKRPDQAWTDVSPSIAETLGQSFPRRLAMSAHGEAVAVTKHAERGVPRLVATRWSADAGWTKWRPVTAEGDRPHAVSLATDAAGRALLAWQTNGPRRSSPRSTGIKARPMSRTGVWGRTSVIVPRHVPSADYPTAMLGRDGLALVLYPLRDRLIEATRTGSGDWRRTVAASRPGPFRLVRASQAPDGTICILWERYDTEGHDQLYVNIRGADGTWTTSGLLPAEFWGANQSAQATAAALPGGQSVVAYPNDRVGELAAQVARIADLP